MTSTDLTQPGQREHPDGSRLEPGLMARRLFYRVRSLSLLLGERVTKRFAPFGYRPGVFTTLALIAANPGCSQVDLARAGHLDRSLLVAIVDELERKGLASRTRSLTDRRRSVLELTPAGLRLLDEMFVAAMEAEDSVRAAFTDEELARFFEFLERAYQVLVPVQENG